MSDEGQKLFVSAVKNTAEGGGGGGGGGGGLTCFVPEPHDYRRE